MSELKQRPIEFRLWNKEQRTFWPFNLDMLFSQDYSRIGGDDMNGMVITQFTGLLDKNGKKIFEGDIVRRKSSNFVISFENGAFCGDYGLGKFPIGWEAHMTDYEDCDIQDSVWNKRCKVIGNIFETPKLIS